MSTMHDYRTIVVGTDGSSLAGPTVAGAAWLAKHDDADLVIVCAYTGLPRREEARNPATLGGDSQIGQVVGRAAATALLDTVKERDADLVVVGATHQVSLAERLLGTVASDVVKRAPCGVLIVRPRPDAGDLEVPESEA